MRTKLAFLAAAILGGALAAACGGGPSPLRPAEDSGSGAASPKDAAEAAVLKDIDEVQEWFLQDIRVDEVGNDGRFATERVTAVVVQCAECSEEEVSTDVVLRKRPSGVWDVTEIGPYEMSPGFVTPEAGGSRPEPTAVVRTYDAPPSFSIDTAKEYSAVIKTEKGDIRVELLDDEAPQTVNNFVFLARDSFYDGLSFFFVDPDFVAQTGDPTGAGTGDPGYDLPQENPTDTFAQGDLGMVNGSQFFITYTDLDLSDVTSQERSEFTVFGRVTDGEEVLALLTPRSPPTSDAPRADRIITIEIGEY